MLCEFVREQERYTQKQLCDIFKCDETSVVNFIRKLKEFSILKEVNRRVDQKQRSDLSDINYDITYETFNKNSIYIFTFVGIIVIAGRVIKCYPKYLKSNKQPIKEFKQILKVLEKYKTQEQLVYIFEENNGSSFNLLSIIFFLFQDYYENGVYCNHQDIIEHNGLGDILWDKTINESLAILSSNCPYYIDLYTKKRANNNTDYFKCLHECILTLLYRELKDIGLNDLFDIYDVVLSENELDSFGDKEYILYRIENELNVQFNTRKQLVLKAIHAYISNRTNLLDMNAMSLYGTNSFNLVWEKICAEVMDDKLNTILKDLVLPIPLKKKYDKTQKLIDLIEKPLWTITNKTATDTLIPDLISICKIAQESLFIISDAKYYNVCLKNEVTPSGQPGIDSITKQYLYQLAYRQFITDHNLQVRNCFLFPSENNSIEDKGEVSLKMLSDIGLQNIKVRLIPAIMIYDLYLAGKLMDISLLKL